MSDLDDKLREILEDWYPGTQYEEVIPKLKQAFAEKGWMSKEDRFTIRDGNKDLYAKYGLLSGQEWYNKFHELVKDHGFYENVTRDFVDRCAKKASGIENE